MRVLTDGQTIVSFVPISEAIHTAVTDLGSNDHLDWYVHEALDTSYDSGYFQEMTLSPTPTSALSLLSYHPYNIHYFTFSPSQLHPFLKPSSMIDVFATGFMDPTFCLPL